MCAKVVVLGQCRTAAGTGRGKGILFCLFPLTAGLNVGSRPGNDFPGGLNGGIQGHDLVVEGLSSVQLVQDQLADIQGELVDLFFLVVDLEAQFSVFNGGVGLAGGFRSQGVELITQCHGHSSSLQNWGVRGTEQK